MNIQILIQKNVNKVLCLLVTNAGTFPPLVGTFFLLLTLEMEQLFANWFGGRHFCVLPHMAIYLSPPPSLSCIQSSYTYQGRSKKEMQQFPNRT